jgi:hypothetical protein
MATKKTQKAATGPTCAIDGCDKPVYVRGVCEVHWNDPKAWGRSLRRGSLRLLQPDAKGIEPETPFSLSGFLPFFPRCFFAPPQA